MVVWAGRLLVAIGVLHACFGLWFGRGPLGRIVADGFVNAVDAHLDRTAVFWFLIASPLLWMLGQLAAHFGSRGLTPPAWFAWQLLAVTLIGVILMPVSGFWLLLAPGLLLLMAARRTGAH